MPAIAVEYQVEERHRKAAREELRHLFGGKSIPPGHIERRAETLASNESAARAEQPAPPPPVAPPAEPIEQPDPPAEPQGEAAAPRCDCDTLHEWFEAAGFAPGWLTWGEWDILHMLYTVLLRGNGWHPGDKQKGERASLKIPVDQKAKQLTKRSAKAGGRVGRSTVSKWLVDLERCGLVEVAEREKGTGAKLYHCPWWNVPPHRRVAELRKCFDRLRAFRHRRPSRSWARYRKAGKPKRNNVYAGPFDGSDSVPTKTAQLTETRTPDNPALTSSRETITKHSLKPSDNHSDSGTADGRADGTRVRTSDFSKFPSQEQRACRAALELVFGRQADAPAEALGIIDAAGEIWPELAAVGSDGHRKRCLMLRRLVYHKGAHPVLQALKRTLRRASNVDNLGAYAFRSLRELPDKSLANPTSEEDAQ